MKRYIWYNPKNEKGGEHYGKWWHWEKVELMFELRADHQCKECCYHIHQGDPYYNDTFFYYRQNKHGTLVLNRLSGKPILFPKTNTICPFCWKGVNLLEQFKQDRLAELRAEYNELKEKVTESSLTQVQEAQRS